MVFVLLAQVMHHNAKTVFRFSSGDFCLSFFRRKILLMYFFTMHFFVSCLFSTAFSRNISFTDCVVHAFSVHRFFLLTHLFVLLLLYYYYYYNYLYLILFSTFLPWKSLSFS